MFPVFRRCIMSIRKKNLAWLSHFSCVVIVTYQPAYWKVQLKHYAKFVRQDGSAAYCKAAAPCSLSCPAAAAARGGAPASHKVQLVSYQRWNSPAQRRYGHLRVREAQPATARQQADLQIWLLPSPRPHFELLTHLAGEYQS
jgi:hypothetical protein